MLHKLQNEFKKYVIDGTPSNDLTSEIIDNGVNSEAKLNIYRSTIRENLTNALRITYPLTAKIIGEGFLDFVASSYVFKFLPNEGSLLGYGKEFPEYLGSLEQMQSYLFVKDFANFEWLASECHDAHEEYPISAIEMQQLLEKGIVPDLKIRSCVKAIASKYAIDKLWDLLRKNKDIHEGFQIELTNESYLMLAKIEYEIEVFPLEKSEFEIIEKMNNGHGLEDALASFSSENEAAITVSKLMNLGAFCL